MNRIALLLMSMWLGMLSAHAQFATVPYDYELNTFGDYQPLPAERSLMFTGLAPAHVDMVEVLIFNAKGTDGRAPLARGSWRRQAGDQGGAATFKVPIDYPLEAGKRYDILIQYFAPLEAGQKQELHAVVMRHLRAYLNQAFDVNGKKLQLTRKTNQVFQDLNDIVRTALANYRFHTGSGFSSFSDLVYNELERLERVKLSKKPIVPTLGRPAEATASPQEVLIGELLAMLDAEVKSTLNRPMSQLVDARLVDDYPVAERKGFFALNIGYGAVFIEGDLNNLTYGRSVYAGLAFPLSTSRLAPSFARNASLTMGVFFDDFTSAAGDTVTGPIVGKPMYLGLDYKLFQFVRLNAGATFLETRQQNGGGSTSKVFVQPFIGISGKVNISLSLDQ